MKYKFILFLPGYLKAQLREPSVCLEVYPLKNRHGAYKHVA